MSKTVKEHLDETSEITKHLKDGDALVRKLQSELETTRSALEWMKDFNHPEFKRPCSYQPFRPTDKHVEASLGEVAKARIQAINALLGDRA